MFFRIETQDAILQDVNAGQVVEVGPSNILTNMMKRTWDNKFASRDLAQSIHRRFLGPQGDLDEIYYRAPPASEDEDEQPLSKSSEVSNSSAQPPAVATPTTQAVLSLPVVVTGGGFDDAPVPTSSIIKTIIATKAKKNVQEVSLDKSISDISAGRSTLSNEIVGDLDAEFPGKLPDRPESLSLEELSQALGTTVDHLGKSTTSLVAKMISSKLPGDYSQSRVRQTLKVKWGLEAMRQDAVLLLAVAKQPAARISDAIVADGFLDELAGAYFQQEGLSLASRPGAGNSSASEATVVDSKALEAANEKNMALIKNVVEVLNGHLELKTKPAVSASVNSEAEKSSALWLAEHGDEYAAGIVPKFDSKKLRVYDSYWNWNAQDVERFFTLCKASSAIQAATDEQSEEEDLSTRIINRACDRTLTQLRYLGERAETEEPGRKRLIMAMWLLREACLAAKDRDPVFVNRTPDLAPSTTIDGNGSVSVSEFPRNRCPLGGAHQPETTELKKTKKKGAPDVSDCIFPVGEFNNGEVSRLKRHTIMYAQDLAIARHSGFTFAGKNVLITGAGKNSIGFNILRGLLTGGARVIVTTSSYSKETADMYQSLYAKHGSKGSILKLVPFNQGSSQDVESLMQWIDQDNEWDLDFIIPFAALSVNGRDLENLDSRSEIALRLMLTNLLRMLGAIVRCKRAKGIITRPATVLLPLSPNHGLMGGDGMYSESKRSLEALLAKWNSESWADYLSLLGVIIGWTRGTGLMEKNDTVAQAVESMGVRTFSSQEMAANIVTLMGGSINSECQSKPLVADLGGGLGKVKNFKDKISVARRAISEHSDIQRAILEDNLRDAAVVDGDGKQPRGPSTTSDLKRVSPSANIQLSLPALPDYDQGVLSLSRSLEGMVDLSRVVVITGFAELGPHGNSRTRWEMEANGTLSAEGCIEMAWMMGLIKHQSSHKDASQSPGWVDAKTLEPIDDITIRERYMTTILEHTGLRKIEPEICDNEYDPEQKQSLQEIVLQRDLPSFETTPEIAENMKRKHGDKVIVEVTGPDACHVQLKAGALIMVPRSAHFNRTVAGQIPHGWSAKRYGIDDDIIEQVDPVTVFSLVCTAEAFLSSGITDPYEWYQYIHVSELGNCLGSSMGGLSSLRKMHRDRFIDRSVKSDVLQETFVNTTGAWINMLLTSSAGPIKTPVGACATSLESLDTGFDLIVSRKAKVVLVGGMEDFVEDVSYEFGSMKATCDTDAEFAAGRHPTEMSRPTASSRSGFVESQGCGVQVLTTAELALKMGLPIRAIVGHTSMSADKAGRSVPAPGRGVLTNARESPALSSMATAEQSGMLSRNGFETVPSPLLNLEHRRKLISRRKKQIKEYVDDGLEQLEDTIETIKQSKGDRVDEQELEQYRQQNIDAIHDEARRQEGEVLFGLGNEFWKSDTTHKISPIRGSLATWGLGIDDISVASLHGTSTVKNDLNEPSVIQAQMKHLGRRSGNSLPCVCQKWLTGHSKGAAGAWMVNGCLQMMATGVIPGNRNADNVDEKLREHQHLLFPNLSMPVSDEAGIKACSVTSFGFGQKGSQAILIHPRYLFAAVSKDHYKAYAARRDERWKLAARQYSGSLVHENMVSHFIKSQPPYQPEDEVATFLNADSRFG